MLNTNQLGCLYKATCDEILPYYNSKNPNPVEALCNGSSPRAGDCIARTAVALALAEHYTDKEVLAQIFYSTYAHNWRGDRFTHARAITEGAEPGTTLIMDSDRSGFMGTVWFKTSSGLPERSGVRRAPNLLRRGQRHEALTPDEFSYKFIKRAWEDVAGYVIGEANDLL